MVRRLPLLVALLELLVSSLPAAPVATMAPSELKPGMKGIGKTVFFGTKIEEFGVEVIDVMPNVWPRGDMILCRLSGHGLEEAGIVAGMSGSPVYIDGKLIGAVAYGWGFSKEPIAGITPIGQMLDVWDQSAAEGSRSDRSNGTFRHAAAPGSAAPRALPVPVAVSGLTPALSEVITPALAEFNLVPVAAAGRSGRQTDTAALVPGAVVGVALTDGDVQLTGIGTLTWRDGNRILAFGHPMFQAGKVNMPMIGGIIHSVLPSVDASFKLFSPTSAIGTVTEDRLPAIGGIIGPVPTMIPVAVNLRSATSRDRYRFRVVDQEDLFAPLVGSGVTEVIFQTEGTMENVTLTSRMTARFHTTARPGTDSLVVRHRFAGSNPGADLFRKVRNELDALISNEFEPIVVESVGLDLEFHRGIDVAYLLGAEPGQTTVRPGETVRTTLRLRDWRGMPFEETLAIEVPPTAPEGSLSIAIAPADTIRQVETSRAPALLEPLSVTALVRQLAESGRENELVITGYTEERGLTAGDAELPVPPPSLRSVFAARDPSQHSSTYACRLFRTTAAYNRIILGSASIRLKVRR